MLKIAVTGGIGSGKSTVCKGFARFGVQTVDTDQIAHSLTAPQGVALSAITAAFGSQVIQADGSLNRAVMRQLVFTDSQARAQLENILHPLIREISDAQMQAATGPYVLLGIPILQTRAKVQGLPSASKGAQRFDRVLVVDCAQHEQLSRVIKRSNGAISQTQARAIMNAQLSRFDRLFLADDIVLNFNDQADLEEQIESLHSLYCKL
jgi:dephospho-CoA kinase